jgi:superkiller protein 3
MKKSTHLPLFAALQILSCTVPALVAAQTPETKPETPTATAPATQPDAAAPANTDESNVLAVTTAYNSGLAALKRDDIEAAGKYFETVVQMSPKDVNALMFLGYVRFKQDRYDDALVSLEAAKQYENQLAPKSRAALYNNLGLAYWNRKQVDLAITSYQKALQLDSNSVDARYNLASALLAQKRWKEAVPHFVALTIKNPKDATLQDGLGMAYEKTGDWSKAMTAYKKAMELNPKEAAYPLNLALALEKTGRQTDAVQYFRKAVQLDPQNADALLHLGDIFISRGRWADAQDVLSRYVALRPNDFVGWYNLGVSYDYHAKFDNALQAYGRAEELQPKDASVKNNIGRIYYKRGKLDEGVTKLREALEHDNSNMDARYNLGLVLAAQNKWQDANAEWKRVLVMAGEQMQSDISPEKKKSIKSLIIVARGAIAENYLKARQFADAASEYKQLLALSPGNLPALTNRGYALYHIKEYEDAETTYREIIKRDPKNAFAYNNLGAVIEARGKRAEALDMYRKALQLKPDYSEAKSNIDRLMAMTVVG